MALGVTQKRDFRKTIAEKELLRNISALEDAFSFEKDEEKKKELLLQLNDLKSRLLMISGTTYTDLRMDNTRLKNRVKELEAKVAALASKSAEQSMITIPPQDAVLRLHRIILARYSDLLNEKEQKTVGEIKLRVTKDDLTIQSLAQSFSGSGYSFPENFPVAAQRAYNYVKDEIEYVDSDTGISFWLEPREIIAGKLGDDEDMCVLLCSLLFALGDSNAECVIAELEDSKTHAFVITNLGKNFLLLDPVQKLPFNAFSGGRNEVLEKYSFRGLRIKRFLYKFNNSNYEQFAGE